MDNQAFDRHLVALTRGSAYHLLGRTCLGVVDRRHGVWQRDHGAVDALLRGALWQPEYGVHTTSPGFYVGDRLVFDLHAGEHVTGPVLSVEELAPLRSQRLVAEVRGAGKEPTSGDEKSLLQRLMFALGARSAPANGNRSGI